MDIIEMIIIHYLQVPRYPLQSTVSPGLSILVSIHISMIVVLGFSRVVIESKKPVDIYVGGHRSKHARREINDLCFLN